MQTGVINGLKPKFIKQMALLMSICYLMTPFQHQITSVLHELSHGLEMPDSVLSHKVNTHNYIEIHEQHEHKEFNSEHEHALIDLVDLVFDASNENKKSDKTLSSEVKLKKHITTNDILLPFKVQKETSKVFFVYSEEVNIGFPKELDAPPKYDLI